MRERVRGKALVRWTSIGKKGNIKVPIAHASVEERKNFENIVKGKDSEQLK